MRFDPSNPNTGVTQAAIAITAADQAWFGPRDLSEPVDLVGPALKALAAEGFHPIDNPADLQNYVEGMLSAKISDYKAQIAEFGTVVNP